jgi:hypothetical protein
VEIDAVVSSLPTDKSLGPDGFNTDFVKKYWAIIKHDFYKLCDEFHAGTDCLQSLNRSHISLLPKVDGPTKVSDFRPIYLLITSFKILTKLLANILQQVIWVSSTKINMASLNLELFKMALLGLLSICIVVINQESRLLTELSI